MVTGIRIANSGAHAFSVLGVEALVSFQLLSSRVLRVGAAYDPPLEPRLFKKLER